jgi:putative Mg2+ transporter-C (MgtC) family protein
MSHYQIYIHGIGSFNAYIGLTIELLSALICGALIGIDRESRHKSAGLRTNILISVGAMLYTATSMMNMTGEVIGGPVDPNRVMAQIVSGIGFLGAGAIIQSRGNVVGLTTAASIWIVAALGATAGSGYVIEALVFAFMVVIILKNSKYVLRILPNYSKSRMYSLQLLSIGEVMGSLENNLEIDRYEIQEKDSQIIDEGKNLILTNIVINETSKNMIRIARKCRRIVQVEKVSFVHYRGFESDDSDSDDEYEET